MEGRKQSKIFSSGAIHSEFFSENRFQRHNVTIVIELPYLLGEPMVIWWLVLGLSI